MDEFRDAYSRQPPPKPPSAFQMSLYIRYLKLKDRVDNAFRTVWNYTFGLLLGRMEYVKTLIPINHVYVSSHSLFSLASSL
jgi:hypothetical protein